MPWIKEKKKPDGYWNVKEHVMEEGKKYRNRKFFFRKSLYGMEKNKRLWLD